MEAIYLSCQAKVAQLSKDVLFASYRATGAVGSKDICDFKRGLSDTHVTSLASRPFV
ncbi:MAG: hypothetical protein AAF636_02005 [Pseudomonadota bacterium]